MLMRRLLLLKTTGKLPLPSSRKREKPEAEAQPASRVAYFREGRTPSPIDDSEVEEALP